MFKKFIFTPLCNIEKTEKMLSDYEEKGFRVKKNKGKHLYYFDEAPAKRMEYFICCSLGKESDSMVAWEINLASQHHAQKIHESMACSVYRTSESAEKLAFLRATRADYIKGALLKIIAIKLLFFVLWVAVTILEQGADRISALCLSVAIALSILYTSICFIKQLLLCKKYNSITNEESHSNE